MTRKEALIALRDAVQDGTAKNRFVRMCGPCHLDEFSVAKAFNGSLDAARALHDALLPGWDWVVASCDENGRGHPLAIVIPDASADNDDHTVSVQSDNPARAWLLAILEALIAQNDE